MYRHTPRKTNASAIYFLRVECAALENLAATWQIGWAHFATLERRVLHLDAKATCKIDRHHVPFVGFCYIRNMERVINNIAILVILLGYVEMMIIIACGVGFEESGSIAGFVIIAPMLFIPFGAAIYRIRANKRRDQRREK